MAVVKCTKCGKVFNTEGAILKPTGDGGYAECCPECGGTCAYGVDEFQYDEDRLWKGFQKKWDSQPRVYKVGEAFRKK